MSWVCAGLWLLDDRRLLDGAQSGQPRPSRARPGPLPIRHARTCRLCSLPFPFLPFLLPSLYNTESLLFIILFNFETLESKNLQSLPSLFFYATKPTKHIACMLHCRCIRRAWNSASTSHMAKQHAWGFLAQSITSKSISPPSPNGISISSNLMGNFILLSLVSFKFLYLAEYSRIKFRRRPQRSSIISNIGCKNLKIQINYFWLQIIFLSQKFFNYVPSTTNFQKHAELKQFFIFSLILNK